MVQPSRAALLKWYRHNRDRSRSLFGLISDDAFYTKPIALRHPIVFYEGHLPGFSFNTLMKRALGAASIDPHLELLFARGIDPDPSAGAGALQSRDHAAQWPSRATVRAFADQADRQIVEALQTADFDAPGRGLDPWEAAFTMLEHEAMHQETLLYMWHRLPFAQKIPPVGYQPSIGGATPRVDWIEVPAGCVTLGVDRSAIPFAWDNECPSLSAHVETFAIERHNVTNERFLEFVEEGGYRQERWWTPEDWQWVATEGIGHPLFWERRGDRWWWRGMFDLIPLPLSWPVHVSMAEASAFARWNGARLPTEAEFQRAAYGSPEGERRYPWGSEQPSTLTGVFDFNGWDPQSAGSHPSGKSAWGIDDLVGNGWEWTSTPFAPFPGFHAMASYPEYSAEFFDGQHFVMKGASVATARELIRPTFRNWFRRRYPYVYATFRCVRDTPIQR